MKDYRLLTKTDLRGRYADTTLSPLELAAIDWLDGFYQLEHLLSAREWAIRLAGPRASDALKFAALTHDAERFFPGGPTGTPQGGFADADYLFQHSTRSSNIVCDWLDKRGGIDPAFRTRVRALILRHEIGGNPEEDIMQAADSLAWFSTFDWLVIGWVKAGIYTVEGAREKLDFMMTRVRVREAIALALPIYARICAALENPPEGLDPAERRKLASGRKLLLGE